MARGKQNCNPNSNGENDFKVETIISRLEKIHHVLKEVEEIKDSLVCMAQRSVEVERKMQRKDEELTRARKKIEDLNKENEQLKGTCFRRCSVELKRVPLSQIQRRRNSTQNCAETVNRLQSEMQIDSIPKIGGQNNLEVSDRDVHVQDPPDELKALLELIDYPEKPRFSLAEHQPTSANDADCELPVQASNQLLSTENVLPQSMDYQPVFKTEEQVFDGNEVGSEDIHKGHLSAASLPEFSSTIQEFISAADSVSLELAGPSSRLSCSEGGHEHTCEKELPVQRIKDEPHYGDEEILGPDCVHHLPVQEIEEQDCQDVLPPVNREDSSSTMVKQTVAVPTKSQSEPSTVMTCQSRLLRSRGRPREYHAGKKRRRKYQCPHCCYSTNKSRLLSTHKRLHKRKRVLMCQVCYKVFPFRSVLLLHMNMHT